MALPVVLPIHQRDGDAGLLTPARRPAPWRIQARALDHSLTIAVVPDLAARFYNLDALPAKENQAKAARIGRRELDFARQWYREGLLSAAGLQAVAAVE